MRRSSQHHAQHQRFLHEPTRPSSATNRRAQVTPYNTPGSSASPSFSSSAYPPSIPLPSHFGSTTSTTSAPNNMPPAHAHGGSANLNTIYVPVVSPPTPAPSPGPIEGSHLFPPSPTSSGSAYSPPSSPSSAQPLPMLSTQVNKHGHSPPGIRRQLLSTLVAACTPEELLFISTLIAPRLKRDFLSSLPTELALHVLSFVDDPRTLCRAEQVCRRWAVLCEEEGVWRNLAISWRWVDEDGLDANQLYDRDGYAGGRFGGVQDGFGPRVSLRRRMGECIEATYTPSPTTSEDPLEEMEQFANFPTDPALEWLITKRRQELGCTGDPLDPKGKGKAKVALLSDLDVDEDYLSLPGPRSSKEYFKACYITMSNWRHGGALLRSHRIPPLNPTLPSSTSTPPLSNTPSNPSAPSPNTSHSSSNSSSAGGAPVVTSIALDADWTIIGLANSRVQIYSARTGVHAKTLVGHELGVWSVGLIGRGGWEAEPRDVHGAEESEGSGSASPTGSASSGCSPSSTPPRRGTLTGGSVRKATAGVEAAPKISASDRRQRPPSEASGRRRRTRNSRHGDEPSPALDHLVPPSLRVAIGLDLYVHTSEEESDESESVGSGSEGASNPIPNNRLPGSIPIPRIRIPDERAYMDGASGEKRGGRPQVKRRFSDMCYSSVGWGQPNAIVVSGGCDKFVMVWDVKTGHCIYRLAGHTSTIRCIRVLDNRPIAVSGSRDSTVRVWDIRKGRCLRVLRGHEQSVRTLDCAGSLVVSGSYDTTVRVWDVDSGECIHVLQGHFHQIYSVAFDGRYIASGGLDTTVRLWDVETGRCLALLQGHTALVCQLQLSPSLLITGGSDGRVITFDLDTLSIKQRIAAHDCSVTGLQFIEGPGSSSFSSSFPMSPTKRTRIHGRNDDFVVTSGNDGRVRLYEVETGDYVRDLSEGAESVWKVVCGWGKCVVVCKRAGKTVVEVWSMGRRAGDGVGGSGGGRKGTSGVSSPMGMGSRSGSAAGRVSRAPSRQGGGGLVGALERSVSQLSLRKEEGIVSED